MNVEDIPVPGPVEQMSKEERDFYRRMTPSDKVKLTLEFNRRKLAELRAIGPEAVEAYFAQVRRENDEENVALLAAFARLRESEVQNDRQSHCLT